MKKLLFFVFIFYVSFSKAQTNVYHPFPDSNAVWNETYGYLDQSDPYLNWIYNPHIYFIAGDTIISNKHYQRVLSSGYENHVMGNCCYYYSKYVGAIRQDSIHKKVYYCNAYSTDTLLYDFNLQIGDTLPISYINNNNQGKNFVSSIDSILIGTSYRKQYHISNYDVNIDSNYVYLIEGIGSTFGLIYQLTPPFENGNTLNCFGQNNVTLYTNPNGNCDLTLNIKTLNVQNSSFQIFPNPNNGSFTIEPSNSTKQTLQIFDINGKMLLSQPITGKTTIDVTNLAEGVYNLSLLSNEGIINKRLIIVR